MAKGKNSALALLGDILAESQAEAEAEEQRLAEEARQAKEAERKARLAEEEKLKAEAAERLAKVRPTSTGQAARIPGITPGALVCLWAHARAAQRRQRG